MGTGERTEDSKIHTRTHKTARSAVNKTVLLPIVLPVFGVHGKIWAVQRLRSERLDFGIIDGSLFKLLDSLAWAIVREITFMDVTKFRGSCFEGGTVDPTTSRMSSHNRL